MAETTTPRGPRPCRCSEYFIARDVEVNGQPDFADVARTTCGKQVAGKQTFAAGHDAKLKSLLILAKRTGREVKQEQGGVLIHHVSPADAAAEYGFGHMVANAKLPADKKAKDAKPAAKPEVPSTVTIKVGRWTYEATINSATGQATYKDKKGVQKSTSQFAIVSDEKGEAIPF